MNPFRKIAGGFSAMARVFGNELRTIIHDPGVLLFFVALPLVYPIIFLYTTRSWYARFP